MGAAGVFCAVHSGKAKVSERGREGLLRAMYCTFCVLLRNRSAVVFGVEPCVLVFGEGRCLSVICVRSDGVV